MSEELHNLPSIPGYRLLRPLGDGGMAKVYLGIQENLNRRVAIKVLEPRVFKDPGLAVRFMREAEMAAALQHSSIVSIYDVGQVGEWRYIVMECLEGNLGEAIFTHAGGKLSAAEAEAILRPLALALDYAHREGIIHRDIKPDNIMFRRDGTPVLVDFGIAKALGGDLDVTKTGTSIGTPHYMSPEQANAGEVDGRSDFYSLGVVLYEMLTGEKPFPAESYVAVVMRHLHDPVPRLPSEVARFQPLLERMMAKTPGERVASGREVIALLDRLGAPPEKLPQPNPSVGSPAGVGKKAKPLLFWAGLVAAFLLAGVALGVLLNRPAAEEAIPASPARPVPGPLASPPVSKVDRSPANPALPVATETLSRQVPSPPLAVDAGAPPLLPTAPKAGSVPATPGKPDGDLSAAAGTTLVRLRAQPIQIDHDEIAALVRRFDFAEATSNPGGRFAGRLLRQGEVIVDRRTARMFAPGAIAGDHPWEKGQKELEKLNQQGFAGFHDWRLPTLEEGLSLLRRPLPGGAPRGDPALGEVTGGIWTADQLSGTTRWTVRFDQGLVFASSERSAYRLLPVRNLP